MHAHRIIQSLSGDTVTIHLPPEFSGCRQAEIIVLPLDETKPVSTQEWLAKTWGAIPGFPSRLTQLPMDTVEPL
jgi:hypothetical protein